MRARCGAFRYFPDPLDDGTKPKDEGKILHYVQNDIGKAACYCVHALAVGHADKKTPGSGLCFGHSLVFYVLKVPFRRQQW